MFRRRSSSGCTSSGNSASRFLLQCSFSGRRCMNVASRGDLQQQRPRLRSQTSERNPDLQCCTRSHLVSFVPPLLSCSWALQYGCVWNNCISGETNLAQALSALGVVCGLFRHKIVDRLHFFQKLRIAVPFAMQFLWPTVHESCFAKCLNCSDPPLRPWISVRRPCLRCCTRFR